MRGPVPWILDNEGLLSPVTCHLDLDSSEPWIHTSSLHNDGVLLVLVIDADNHYDYRLPILLNKHFIVTLE